VGKRGPPPKPSALKKLQGTFRKDRAARNELVAPPGAPPMPKFPPKVRKIAAAKWQELVPLLLERGTLSKEDGVALEQFCRFWTQWLTYQAAAEREPMIETMYGVKVNPAAELALKLEQRLTALGDRLGLTASARSKVSVPEKPKPEDNTEAFLFGKPQVIQGGKA
jgi:P27 family predicted phage terminase small subunit